MKKHLLLLVIFSSCSHPQLQLKDLQFNEQERLARVKNKVATEFIISPFIDESNHPADTMAVLWFDTYSNCTKKLEQDTDRLITHLYTYDSIGWLTTETIDCTPPIIYNYRYIFNPSSRRMDAIVSGYVNDTNHYYFNEQGLLMEQLYYENSEVGKGVQFKFTYEYDKNGKPIAHHWAVVKCNEQESRKDSLAGIKWLVTQFDVKYFYTDSILDSTISMKTIKHDESRYNKTFSYYKDGMLSQRKWLTGRRYEYRYSTIPFVGSITIH